MTEYPEARFVIKSGNYLQDLELATELFNEASGLLTKQKIPFRVEVRSGSFDFSIMVLLDMLNQVTQNATIAAAVGGVIGGITTKILDRKRSIKKPKFNAAWKNILKLQKTINRNLNKKLESLSIEGNVLKVKFRDENRVSIGHVKLVFTSRSERERELERRVAELEKMLLPEERKPRWLEQRIVEKVDAMGTQDLIVIALRLRPNQTKGELKKVLLDWGKAFGSWFDGGTFSGRLLKKGLVKIAGQNNAGESIYSLTKKGELEADSLIEKLQARIGSDELPSLGGQSIDYSQSKFSTTGDWPG